MKIYNKMSIGNLLINRLSSWLQAEKMKEFLTNMLNFFGLAWWVEIVTENPGCTYFFGPFLTAKEAGIEKDGYLEDLEQEGAKAVSVNIKRCKPQKLTIDREAGDRFNQETSPKFSSQPL